MNKIIAVLLILTMALSLAACGSEAPAQEVRTVVYWTTWKSTEPQAQVIATSLRDFTRETGIQVVLKYKNPDTIHEELQLALELGETVDLLDDDIDCINTVFASYLMDLEPLAEKYGYEDTAMAQMIAACREAGGGRLMSIPYQPWITAFFYNAAVFEDAGVSAPATWAELLDVCEKIQAAGYTPIACDNANLTSMIGYHLGRLVGEDGVRDIVSNGRWDDPAVIQFAQQYAELAARGYISSNAAFPDGQTAMYLGSSRLPNAVKGVAGENFRWGCFPYPEVENGTVGTEAASFGAHAIAIHKDSEVSEEAFQVIRYLTKGEPDSLMAAMSFSIPSDTANSQWPDMVSCVKPVMEAATVRWSKAAGAESNSSITPAIREMVRKLCDGTITPEQFVENMLAAAGN